MFLAAQRNLYCRALLSVVFLAGAFKSLLTRVGISHVTIPFGDIDVSDAGGTVATLNSGLQDSIERLQQIQSTVKDPRTNSDLQSITDKLKNLQQDAETTDETIKSNLVTRQATLEKTSSQSVKNPGWLLAGHVDKDGLNWVGDSARKIPATLSPKFTQGEQFSVTSPAYLRANIPFRIHFKGKVVYVVPANGRVKVIAGPDYSPAIAGGSFCWVKVQPL